MQKTMVLSVDKCKKDNPFIRYNSIFSIYLENNPIILLSPGACLREAPPCGAEAGERAGVRGNIPYPPPPESSPVKGEDYIW